MSSNSQKFLDFPAALVVEILSDATALKDRHTKFGLYQNFGIKYYLIVDPEKESIEIYFLENSKYTLQENSNKAFFTFLLSDDCKIDVDTNNFWE